MGSDDASVFPDRRWGRDGSRLQELAVRLSSTGFGASLIKRLVPLDRTVLLRTNGRLTVLGPIAAPVLLLTTTGARTGRSRTTPLLFARDEGDTLVVVGSNFGQAHHPAWTANLLAHPEAIVRVGGATVPVAAQLLHGHQAEQAYERMVTVARTYAEYRSRTDRTIRVFRLTPAS